MSDVDTPFHAGELAIQDRLGVREKVQKYAPKMIRHFMPDQHRDFFRSLPHFFVGSVDAEGRPWASMLWGAHGFIGSDGPQHLRIGTVPCLADPLFAALRTGAEIGGIGMMFHNRRRNRVNGRVVKVDETGFDLKVTQSFGNCPQYIQAREVIQGTTSSQAKTVAAGVERRTMLSAMDRHIIAQADTFFIATASAHLGEDVRRGADMSHRGGAPGFVKYLEDGALLIPDFSGNRHFNTLGNIRETGRAGLLFLDFACGDLLHVTGSAEIIWPDAATHVYDGAERYLKVSPEYVIYRPAAVSLGWNYLGASPRLPKGAIWKTAM